MRKLLLAIPYKFLALFIIGLTIALAFLMAFVMSEFFDTHELVANTDLISVVYQVMGTVYAILLTFTLWGVWQKYNDANNATQNEAYALLDLVHTLEASPELNHVNIRHCTLAYAQHVVTKEWALLKNNASCALKLHEPSHPSSQAIVEVVQGITPTTNKENILFSKTLTLLSTWLDARRTRLLIASGDSAKALWPLLIVGAWILFGFHGLFVAKTLEIWVVLLFGFSFVIGLTFYLIFALDCPFGKYLGIDPEPFELVINILSVDPKK